MKNRIKKGHVFRLKDNANCFAEIIAVENSKVTVLAYWHEGNEKIEVNCSDLEDILLTDSILNSLGFEQTQGSLRGLPNEFFWYKCIGGFYLFLVKDNGIYKIACNKDNAYYGVKFIPLPFLHELQDIIGNIDTKKLFKDVYNDVK